MEHKVYLTRRNAKTLINKLDRVKRGEASICTLIKQDTVHPKYPQTMRRCAVTGVELLAEGLPASPSQVYLTRQNLEDLLTHSPAAKAYIKESGLVFFFGGDSLNVIFVEDEDYYGPDRPPGFTLDAPN